MCLRTAMIASMILCVTLPAAAASITNRDDKDYRLTIVEAGATSVKSLKIGGVLGDVCSKGCIVRIGDNENDVYELEGSDVVSIEDGLLFSDGSETGNPSVPAAKVPAGRP